MYLGNQKGSDKSKSLDRLNDKISCTRLKWSISDTVQKQWCNSNFTSRTAFDNSSLLFGSHC